MYIDLDYLEYLDYMKEYMIGIDMNGHTVPFGQMVYDSSNGQKGRLTGYTSNGEYAILEQAEDPYFCPKDFLSVDKPKFDFIGKDGESLEKGDTVYDKNGKKFTVEEIPEIKGCSIRLSSEHNHTYYYQAKDLSHNQPVEESKLKITLDLFTEILCKIQQDADDAEKLNQVFRDSRNDFIGGAAFINCELTDLMIRLLDLQFGDDCDWVSYWVYEMDFGRQPMDIEDDGELIMIETIQDLWDWCLGRRPVVKDSFTTEELDN